MAISRSKRSRSTLRARDRSKKSLSRTNKDIRKRLETGVFYKDVTSGWLESEVMYLGYRNSESGVFRDQSDVVCAGLRRVGAKSSWVRVGFDSSNGCFSIVVVLKNTFRS